MRTGILKSLWTLGVVIGLMIVGVVYVTPALSQDQPAGNMQILRDKLEADKKLLVAVNMQLTESEAKDFWPVYENFQKDLDTINQRIKGLIESYAADYRANTLTNEKAKKLVDELVSTEQADAALKASYVPRLSKVLPQIKVARYLQIETKIRAIVKYDIAAQVPLVQ